MSNFGTRQDPDPTPFGEESPCFCQHEGRLELGAYVKGDKVHWSIVMSESVRCTKSPTPLKGDVHPKKEGAWTMTNSDAIHSPFSSVVWKFAKLCGNCTNLGVAPCHQSHDLPEHTWNSTDLIPITAAPSAVQKLLDFVKPEFERIPNISLIESIILLATIKGEFLNSNVYSDPSLPKDPTTKTCAEVSQWCKGTSPFP